MPLPKAPGTYPTDLESLWGQYVDQLYVPPSVLREFHDRLAEYLRHPSRTFWIRHTGDLGQRERRQTEQGLTVVGTDNSPAWWIHAQLMTNDVPSRRDFGSFLNRMPCHMFDIRNVQHANHAGWYFAHVEPVKNGNSNWRTFDADELTGRMVRSLHPMNYFFVPKTWGRQLGEDPVVIAYFREKLRQRYADLVERFDRLTSGTESNEPSSSVQAGGEVVEAPPRSSSQRRTAEARIPRDLTSGAQNAEALQANIPMYEKSRLWFIRDVIEPLAPDQQFGIRVRDVGLFVMTKADFYEDFSNVVRSRSYQVDGNYHYTKIPKRAHRYLRS